jgi:hypothetical protein
MLGSGKTSPPERYDELISMLVHEPVILPNLETGRRGLRRRIPGVCLCDGFGIAVVHGAYRAVDVASVIKKMDAIQSIPHYHPRRCSPFTSKANDITSPCQGYCA